MNVKSANGNLPIHFASMNDRKGIIEILLRSGSDPSTPNNAGLIPAELCSLQEVRNILLRNTGNVDNKVFMNLTENNMPMTTESIEIKNNETESITMKEIIPYEDIKLKPTVINKNTKNKYAEQLKLPLSSTVMITSKVFPSEDDYDDTTSSLLSNSDEDGYEKLEEINDNVSIYHQNASSMTTGNMISKDSSFVSNRNVRTTEVNHPPPPATVPVHDLDVSSLTNSFASVSIDNNTLLSQSSSSTMPILVKPNVHIPPSKARNPMASPPLPPKLVSISTPSTSSGKSRYKETMTESFKEARLSAAVETAASLRSPPQDADIRRILFKCCQQIDDPNKPEKVLLQRLRDLLSTQPLLANVRAADQGNIAADGSTPLHCAARWGNIPVIRALLSECPEVSVSSWAVDLQGRTALHLAAEYGHEEAVEVLRRAMTEERSLDPIGAQAPVGKRL